MKVLVFDDEPHLRTQIENVLREHNYEVASFALPSEAANSLENTDEFPALALLDIKFEVGSEAIKKMEEGLGFPQHTAGFEIAKKIKRIKNIPIIFLSGFPDLFEEAKAYKPYNFFVKGSLSIKEDLPRHIATAINNFEMEEVPHPSLRYLEKGKICLNIISQSQSIKQIISIEDILYIEASAGITSVYVKNRERPHKVTMNGTDFMQQLESVLAEKNLPNSLLLTKKGVYCNLNKINSFDSDFAYFEPDEKVKCPLTLASFQQLTQTYFPAFRTDFKKNH